MRSLKIIAGLLAFTTLGLASTSSAQSQGRTPESAPDYLDEAGANYRPLSLDQAIAVGL